jgi:hypothetical protein
LPVIRLCLEEVRKDIARLAGCGDEDRDAGQTAHRQRQAA